MERNWDVKVQMKPGYWTTCHRCGEDHRADSLCPCYRDMLIEIQSNMITRTVRKVMAKEDK